MRLPVLIVVFLLSALTSAAQITPIGPAGRYMDWSASVVPDSVRPGGPFQLVLDVEIEAPWKMYALDESLPSASGGPRPFGVAVEWTLPEGVRAEGGARQSQPEAGFDTNFSLDLLWFHEQARFAFPFATASDIPEGTLEIKGTVSYQICNDDLGLCLPPTPADIAALLVVDSNCLETAGDVSMECNGDEASIDALFADLEPTPGKEAPRPTSSGADGGLLAFLLLALGAGLATLLTPCVFPMIPLTVSYFTRHAEDRRKAVSMAALFGVSIVAMFTGLGLVMAGLVGAAGAQTIAANPWVNLFIAAVLVGFALSLLGLYELRLPHALVNYSNRESSKRSGYAGVLFMGLTLTLVSFSCTAPFVGGLLAAAAGGTWLYPLAGMLVFSAAFASPFVVLAAFPNLLSSLPKSGSWMNAFKVTLGFVELAAAIKFISNADLVWGWDVVSRPLAIAVTVVIFALAGLYLIGKIRLPHDPALESVGVGRLMSALICFSLALYMLPGLLGAPLNRLDAFLPPRKGTDVSLLAGTSRQESAVDDESWWVDDIEGALEAAREEGKPVLVDFTGYTCTNCREMEANVFPRPAVAERFESGFVLLRLYTDGLEAGPDFQRYQLGLTGTVALPTYAIVNPQTGRMVAGRSGLMSESEFVGFLDAGLAAYDSGRGMASR